MTVDVAFLRLKAETVFLSARKILSYLKHHHTNALWKQYCSFVRGIYA